MSLNNVIIFHLRHCGNYKTVQHQGYFIFIELGIYYDIIMLYSIGYYILLTLTY